MSDIYHGKYVETKIPITAELLVLTLQTTEKETVDEVINELRTTKPIDLHLFSQFSGDALGEVRVTGIKLKNMSRRLLSEDEIRELYDED